MYHSCDLSFRVAPLMSAEALHIYISSRPELSSLYNTFDHRIQAKLPEISLGPWVVFQPSGENIGDSQIQTEMPNPAQQV